MSVYKTISNDYKVVELDARGNIKRELEKSEPLYKVAMDTMIDSFNGAHLEKYVPDEYKGKVEKIYMEHAKHGGVPYIRINVRFVKGVRVTARIREDFDDYMSAQFSDGWGEGFFYPMPAVERGDGLVLGVM